MKRNLEGYPLVLSSSRNYLVLILIFLSVKVSTSNELRMRKCCPPQEIFSGRSKVDCVPAPNQAMELHPLSNGINLGIPRCEKPEDIATTFINEIRSDDFLRSPACLEILRKESSDEEFPIIVHCHSNEDDTRKEATGLSFPKITTIRRCCPKDTLFDPDTRFCVPSISYVNDTSFLSSDDPFFSFLPIIDSIDFLGVTRGPPNCPRVIFDFRINSSNLIFENRTFKGTLSLSQNGRREEEIKLTEENACVELTPESTISNGKLILRLCRDEEICSEKSCIRKCCPEDQFLISGKRECQKLYDDSITPIEFHKEILNSSIHKDFFREDYGLLIGKMCQDRGMYPVRPEENWSITPEGYIDVPDYKVYGHYEYCMDIFYNSSNYKEGLYPFVCFPKDIDPPCRLRCSINSVLQLTSCAFLLTTLVVYVCLPVLQNLHGKTLMCHVGSLLLAFVCLLLISWLTPDSTPEESTATVSCKFLGYAMLFSFLSAFSWLNVMCFDIWWTFGGSRGNTSTRGRGHRKRFLLYCAYAWGLACLITVLGIVVDHTDFFPKYLRPTIGRASCWFTSGSNLHGELLFFIAPLTLQLLINIVFFVITSINCNKVKTEINRVITDPSDIRNKRFQADRTKLIMNIKLFIVMGISWILEIVSYFLNNYAKDLKWREEFFYASDTFNCLQGLLIFILFVLKSRVYYALRRRLGFEDKKRLSSNATTAVHDTCRVKNSASNSTLMSTFQVSLTP
ncbi:G-protein coupled receptor Mth2-like [Vespa crabro]|uniref:G-protein coupled receptor Mth2-like n=1 Tax=Vespa crabro TaxID=7445 RepID=UPI001F009458|nr:G-protein coupled receptor Mth2-like [Vespa crabro]